MQGHTLLRGWSKQAIVGVLVVLALALVPAPAFASTLDQSQPQTSGTRVSVTSSTGYAQTFTAGLSGAVDQVDLSLSGVASQMNLPLTIEIRDVVGGAPGSNVLATASMTGAGLTLTEAWIPVAFASGAQVTAGTQYAIVAHTLAFEYRWHISTSANPYPAGAAFSSPTSPPSTWSQPIIGFDLAFKTYVRPIAADLSLTIAGPPTVERRGTATYILTVQNAGPNTAPNTVLTSNLPYGVQLTAVTTSQGTCTPPAKGVQTVTCQLGTIANSGQTNSAVTVRIVANAANANVNYVANVRSDLGDPNPSNNSASFSTVVTK
jgi:uncharacterized repeat protein (TIGR01451 family)